MSLKNQPFAEGLSKALRYRARNGVGPVQAVCAVDIATRVGVEVWFQDLPSIDGVYAGEGTPRIIISSLRPPGRRMFTCAHELGHHVFCHGTRIDEYTAEEGKRNGRIWKEEQQANGFAAGLLMPSTAVQHAFALRGWSPATCTPQQAYAISSWFGVSYAGLLDHLSLTLSLMPRERADRLKRVTPKELRSAFLDDFVTDHAVLVDTHWSERTVDIAVGEVAILPNGCSLMGDCCEIISAGGASTIIKGLKPGKSHVTHSVTGWSAFLRVARTGFTGRSCFRHLEDEDE